MAEGSDKGEIGWVLFQVVILVGAVALVEDTALRAAIAAVPAMLLFQRAIGAGSGGTAGWAGDRDRRDDYVARRAVSELLQRIREFYATCHLMRSGQIGTEAAEERINKVEQDLNGLLAKVIETSRGEEGGGD